MQFAGQRTTMSLEPLGEPVNILIKLSPDVVPEPDAILITGITPQKTLQEGITEAEFLKRFQQDVAIADTTFVGFNTVRFDDEFMRFMHYRNFYDPYEWQWKDGRSRWDMLDVVRMTRALRPDGITWPFDAKGTPTNRLELLTSVNNLDHQNAHDALSDVYATIAIARLLKTKQPKLFEYLLHMRHKNVVSELVLGGKPFVYSSGKYPSEFEKTAVVHTIMKHPKKQAALVYDLRHDPTPYVALTPEQLVDKWKWKKDTQDARLPVKTLQFNRCPAIAPLQVLDEPSQKRLKISMKDVQSNLQKLLAAEGFAEKLAKALDILDTQQQTSFISSPKNVDAQLYDSFIPNQDRVVSEKVRMSEPHSLSELHHKLTDPRLRELLPLYKARNHSEVLDPEERQTWEEHCREMLLGGGQSSRLAKFFARLGDLAGSPDLTAEQQYLLEELQIYGQSIMPVIDDDYEAQ